MSKLKWEDGLICKITEYLNKRLPIGEKTAKAVGTFVTSWGISKVKLQDQYGSINPAPWFVYIGPSGIGCKTPTIRFIQKALRGFKPFYEAPSKFTNEAFTEHVTGVTPASAKRTKRAVLSKHPINMIVRDELTKLLKERSRSQFEDKEENQNLIKDEYEKIKTELYSMFQSFQPSLDSIIKSFKKISLTIDPRLPAGYDAEKNIFIWNLWSLFFAITEDPITKKSCVMSAPIWKLGSELIHEYDHFQFSKENKIIGVPEETRKQFDEQTASQREKRAFLSQIDFLKHSKSKIPYDTPINFIRVKRWTNNGNVQNKKKACLTESLVYRNTLIDSIDYCISDLEGVITKIDAGQNYDKVSDKENFRKSTQYVKALSLPIRLNSKQKDYQLIEVKM